MSKRVNTSPAKSPSAPAAAAPAAVAMRGAAAITAVRLTSKAYRSAAQHNTDWWTVVQAQVAAGKGSATVAALLAAKVPAHFVGYTVRRGYLAAA